NAGELGEEPVAGGLDDAAMVLGDLRINELTAHRLKAFECAFLVRPHQPRIPRHIGGENRREPALASWPCGLHGASSMATNPTSTGDTRALSKEGSPELLPRAFMAGVKSGSKICDGGTRHGIAKAGARTHRTAGDGAGLRGDGTARGAARARRQRNAGGNHSK